MSKYTEARKCVERWTFINGNGFTNQDIKDIVGKALEIADRLEHCYFTDHQDDYYNYDDSEYSAGYQSGYIDGYKQALSDARGDTDE